MLAFHAVDVYVLCQLEKNVRKKLKKWLYFTRTLHHKPLDCYKYPFTNLLRTHTRYDHDKKKMKMASIGCPENQASRQSGQGR